MNKLETAWLIATGRSDNVLEYRKGLKDASFFVKEHENFSNAQEALEQVILSATIYGNNCDYWIRGMNDFLRKMRPGASKLSETDNDKRGDRYYE